MEEEEEEYPSSFPMKKSRKLFRRSIVTYLKNYHHFSTAAALTGLPFTAAILLSQAFLPSLAIFPVVHNRLQTLFAVAGFPPSSEIFTVICLKLSQTITFSILLLPFTFSFYLMAKACVIQSLTNGMEGYGGYIGIIQACVLIKGKTTTALTLTLPINMAMAGVEALFHYRVLRGYRDSNTITASMVLEGIFIAYLYSTVLVFDTVVSCVFFRSCRRIDGRNCSENSENRKSLEDLI
ncbi:uncharacterized protein LOC124936689 [Impatiens glandulifera]|uniref:uncharacterized protein LOC124936689 n=1 Tax=Impatiens glandulifera TaxID=253017 RepID=UPI001FB13A6F|nr:uncharacterized protein LOC124936689 [Impatiens glandulifera]